MSCYVNLYLSFADGSFVRFRLFLVIIFCYFVKRTTIFYFTPNISQSE